MTSITLKRSRKRRTLALKISPDLAVSVYAPYFCSKNTIQKFLDKHSLWLEKQKQRLREYRQINEFSSGLELPFLGEKLVLMIEKTEHLKIPTLIKHENNQLILQTPQKFSSEEEQVYLKKQLLNWYKNQAKNYLQTRIDYFSRVLQVFPKTIRIKNQKSVWGSCSRKRNINLNFKIIMLAPKICDYLIVHELCHLKHLNHSKRFWKAVEEILQEFKILKKNLRQVEPEILRLFS